MTIVELTGFSGESIYVVCEHISAIRPDYGSDTNSSVLIAGGNILATVTESPQEVIALIMDAMS